MVKIQGAIVYSKKNFWAQKVNSRRARKDMSESWLKLNYIKKIKQVFESSVNTFINKSYKIKRIINHEKREEQGKLDLDNDFQ